MMNLKDKNYLIIGAGISGISLARMLVDAGANKVKIVEQKSHIGGNCFDYKDKHGFYIHKYGPHIFHTSNQRIIEFITRFSKFNCFTHKVLVDYKGELIPFPINLTAIYKIIGNQNIKNELIDEFKAQKTVSIKQLLNSTNKDINKLGELIYKNIYENYTMKMWDIPADKIDLNVLNRVKINLTEEWNYFPDDNFVGEPTKGWTSMFQKMLEHKNIALYLNTNYKDVYNVQIFKQLLENKVYDAIFFCGMIDELFDFKYGELPYRSINFKFEYLPEINNYQPVSVVNYPADKHLTRITEYKKLTLQEDLSGTVIGKEYPGAYDKNSALFYNPCYPIKNLDTLQVYKQYHDELNKIPNLYAIGRLGQYQYFDTDDAINNVMQIFDTLN